MGCLPHINIMKKEKHKCFKCRKRKRCDKAYTEKAYLCDFTRDMMTEDAKNKFKKNSLFIKGHDYYLKLKGGE